mgnify:CR=1 FL=1
MPAGSFITVGGIRRIGIAIACHKRNKAIGLLNDDPIILHRAIEYLKAFKAKDLVSKE